MRTVTLKRFKVAVFALSENALKIVKIRIEEVGNWQEEKGCSFIRKKRK